MKRGPHDKMRIYSIEDTLTLIKNLQELTSISPVVFTNSEGGRWINWSNRVIEEIMDAEGYYHDIHSMILSDLQSAWVWDNINGFRDKGPMAKTRAQLAGHKYKFPGEYGFIHLAPLGPFPAMQAFEIHYDWEEYPGSSHGGVICSFECWHRDTGLPVELTWQERESIEQGMHPYVLQRYLEAEQDGE